MKSLIRATLAVLMALLIYLPSSKGATIITATITVTNTPGVGTNWIVNGNSRTWTNNTGATPNGWIQITNGPGPTATNLYSHITRFPYLSPFLQVARTGTNTFTLRGSTVVITTNNYFSVTYSTNIGTNLTIVQVPFEAVDGETNRTNNAHWLVDAFNRYPYTNALATNANVLTNALIKGAHPYQEVLGPIGFRGRTAVNSNFFATNGFTSALTNINPVLSNGVNFGNAFRSVGAGGNSLQLGSNALAKGTFSVAAGNNSLASNDNSIAIGTAAKATNQNTAAIGNTAIAGGNGATAVGDNAAALFGNGTAVGVTATAAAPNDTALGAIATASGGDSIALGVTSTASATNSSAIGKSTTASHANSTAFGGTDFANISVSTTDTNQIRIGTDNNRISIPGLLESPKSTNSQFAGTNIARGSWSYPPFALSTLAAGNNISVPIGTNRFVRFNSGPVSAATICGMIGAATSGALDGQDVLGFNDTGFTLTFAVNTVDPVAANRINTQTGTDVAIPDQGFVNLTYDGTDARWKLSGSFPTTVAITNLSIGTNLAPFGFVTTNLLQGQAYTNFTQRGHVVATVAMTNILAGDVSAMSLIVDQDADGTWDVTNGPVRINGVALSAGEEQLFGLLQPGARFAFTNQSAGVSPGVSIRAGSCQWSRW